MTDLELLWAQIERGRNGENIGLSTGIPKLDKVIGGVQPSRFYTIAAASSVGKSALVLFIMYNMLKNIDKKYPVYFLYFSLELPANVLLAKLMSLYCTEEFGVYLTLDDILSFQNPISDENLDHLKSAKKWIEEISSHLTIVDSRLNCSTLYAESLKFAAKFGVFEEENGKKRYVANDPNQRLIGVIDHGLLMTPSEGRELKQEIDMAASYMVTLKNKLNMSWFMLMQQNRDASSMDRRKAELSEPTLNDIKQTGAVGDASDVVIQLFYPFREKLATYRGYRILGDQGLNRWHRSLIISKNRYGIADQVINTWFAGSVGWFKSLPSPDQITDYTRFQNESENIPCKIRKETLKEDTSTSKQVEEKQPIIFSF